MWFPSVSSEGKEHAANVFHLSLLYILAAMDGYRLLRTACFSFPVAPVIGGLQHPVSVCCVLLIFVFLLIHSLNNFYKFGFSGRASYSYIPHIPKLLYSMF